MPMYVWTNEMIRVHMFISVLALLLSNLLYRKIQLGGIDHSKDTCFEVLEDIKEIRLYYDDKGPPEVLLTRLTIHPGFQEMPSPAIKYCYDALIETLQEIVEIGKKYNVSICFENFDKPMLCSELKDYLYVLNSVKGLVATLDVGHANTTNTKLSEFFKETREFIMDIHIHDNMGNRDEHKCLGEGTINFKEFFSECKRAKYYGPFILELFPYENILEGKKRFLDFWEY